MNQQSGFTLLELMVVLVIMGLAASLSVAWLAGSGPQRASTALQQLESDWRLAADMAMGEQRIIGWQVSAQGYRFVAWSVDPKQPGQGQWQPITSRQLPQRQWSQPVELQRTPAMALAAESWDTPRSPRRKNAMTANSASSGSMPWLIWWPNGEVLSATLTLQIPVAGAAPWVRQWRIDGLGIHRQDHST